jgi:hypothetical protein
MADAVVPGLPEMQYDHPKYDSIQFTVGFMQQDEATHVIGPLDFGAHNFTIREFDTAVELTGCEFNVSSDLAAEAAAKANNVTKAEAAWVDVYIPGSWDVNAIIN